MAIKISPKQKWMNQKMIDYNKNPQKTLEDLLVDTTESIRQYIDNPESKTAKGVLQSCLECNELFINYISH